MRAVIAVAALALASLPAGAATFKCHGFAFGYAELTCETVDPARSVAGFCDVMNRIGGPVMWSRDDTRKSKVRADLINAAGRRLCGWGKR